MHSQILRKYQYIFLNESPKERAVRFHILSPKFNKHKVITMNNNVSLDNFSKNELPSQSLYQQLLDKIDFNIDEDYLDFIFKYNGAEGDIGSEAYLSLWDIENVLVCNPYYEDVEECKDLFFFGTEGSNYGYAFEKINGGVIGIDFLDIGNIPPNKIANTFKDFLIALS